jgi:hypothetical protein
MVLNAQEEIFLNQLAQHVIPFEKGLEWFRELDSKKKLEVLQGIGAATQQAHPFTADLVPAASEFGCKQSYTPWVLLSKGPFKAQLAKVLNLPSSEYERSFRILLGLLSVADARRRRTTCVNGCSHWWHEDLSNIAVVNALLKPGGLL